MTVDAPVHTDIPVIDLTCFGAGGSAQKQKATAEELYQACSRYGFVTLTGIGVSEDRLRDLFAYSKRLFDLPLDDKMKAPHPPGYMPHRGYSHIGLEKVYSKAQRDADQAANGSGEELRKTENSRESYEIGSEHNPWHPNIFLPESVYPGFKDQGLEVYGELHQAGHRILDAMCMALGLSAEDAARMKKQHSGQNNQLRLLHYPPTDPEKLASKEIERMPAHQDWSSFTFLFQDSVGGLELQDPDTKQFVPSVPVKGACILNVGDMLMRFSNGVFPSALHRVSLPPISKETLVKSRYSIPYFFAPDHESVVEPLPTLGKPNYDAVRFCDYNAYMSEHMYDGRKPAAVEAK